MPNTNENKNLKGLASFSMLMAVMSWAIFGLLFSILAISSIVWGFIEYHKNGGPKIHFYMLFVAILILLLKIPAILFLF